jgi:hypothetical protein
MQDPKPFTRWDKFYCICIIVGGAVIIAIYIKSLYTWL